MSKLPRDNKEAYEAFELESKMKDYDMDEYHILSESRIYINIYMHIHES